MECGERGVIVKVHGNTLYVQTVGAYLHKEGETVKVEVERETRLTVPLHHLEGIVCFGRVSISPPLMAECCERDIGISWMTDTGRFLCRVVGAESGNVLLRRQQYRVADSEATSLPIARVIVAAKIQNSRTVLLRAARESEDAQEEATLRRAIDRLECSIQALPQAETLNVVRGCEGEAARVYFESFNLLLKQQREHFSMTERSRRPPKDPLNALLSFVYSVLTHDMAAAVSTVGLDAAVGFLHVDRPGRLSLALDLLEEFRAVIADRLVISLINLKQVQPDGFETQPTGAVLMNDATRRVVLAALVQRKKEELTHPLLDAKVPIGLLPLLQARLLARHLRGELSAYPAFVAK
jgi:CRISPR-associated protein Cas1